MLQDKQTIVIVVTWIRLCFSSQTDTSWFPDAAIGSAVRTLRVKIINTGSTRRLFIKSDNIMGCASWRALGYLLPDMR